MSRHLKRYCAPTTWQIERKNRAYITKPCPGPNTIRLSLSTDLILRKLGYAKTKKEIKQILNTQEIQVDGTRVKESKFPVGLLSTFSIPSQKQHFRIVFDSKGKLTLLPITADESNKKISKITGKTVIKGNKLQINLSDGRNFITTDKKYAVGDALLFETPTQKVIDHIKLAPGSLIYLTKGKHVSDIGTLDAIQNQTITYTNSAKEKIQTLKDYAYAIGKEKPLIKIQ